MSSYWDIHNWVRGFSPKITKQELGVEYALRKRLEEDNFVPNAITNGGVGHFSLTYYITKSEEMNGGGKDSVVNSIRESYQELDWLRVTRCRLMPDGSVRVRIYVMNMDELRDR